jgi:hypothetical protein
MIKNFFIFIVLSFFSFSLTHAEPLKSSDPKAIEELDFTQEAVLAPIVKLQDEERLIFLYEPVTLKIKEVRDPDGTCKFFRYDWKKEKGFIASRISIDQKLGDLFFIPEKPGIFLIRVGATPTRLQSPKPNQSPAE